jgi:hypothetical protein
MNIRSLNTNATSLKFKNNHIVYESFIKCTVKDYEFNLSYNPTLLSGSQATLVPFSGSVGGDVFYMISESNYGILKDFAQEKGSTIYDLSVSTGTITGGGANIGNQSDDQVTNNIPIGFDFIFYDKTYNTVNLSSNGNLQFTTFNTLYSPRPLPDAGFGPSIFPFFTDLHLGTIYRPNAGIYTQVLGTAGNRIFCAEWKGVFYYDKTKNVNFQIRLYETTNVIELVYGVMDPSLVNSVIGIQNNFNDSNFKQYKFNSLSPNNGTLLTFNPIKPDITFSPYVTTVGLYNDANDLLAIGKMAAPMPLSSNTDVTFLIKWDTQWSPRPYFTPSVTPSRTPSATPSITPTLSPTPTVTPTVTITPTQTPSVTITPTQTPSVTITTSVTPSVTITPSLTPTQTPSISITPTVTPTPSISTSLPLPSLLPRNFNVTNWTEQSKNIFIDVIEPQSFYSIQGSTTFPLAGGGSRFRGNHSGSPSPLSLQIIVSFNVGLPNFIVLNASLFVNNVLIDCIEIDNSTSPVLYSFNPYLFASSDNIDIYLYEGTCS